MLSRNCTSNFSFCYQSQELTFKLFLWTLGPVWIPFWTVLKKCSQWYLTTVLKKLYFYAFVLLVNWPFKNSHKVKLNNWSDFSPGSLEGCTNQTSISADVPLCFLPLLITLCIDISWLHVDGSFVCTHVPSRRLYRVSLSFHAWRLWLISLSVYF